jgi:hypothetical protein
MMHGTISSRSRVSRSVRVGTDCGSGRLDPGRLDAGRLEPGLAEPGRVVPRKSSPCADITT